MTKRQQALLNEKLKRVKYRYRIDSSLRGTNISPQTFVTAREQVQGVIDAHERELPGCLTKITDMITGEVTSHYDWVQPIVRKAQK